MNTNLTHALAELELQVAAALQQPGAPVRTILNAKRSLLLVIEGMPELAAIALVQETTRYVRHLAGYRHCNPNNGQAA